MRILRVGDVCLLSVVLTGVKVSEAARETLTVSEGGVTFTIMRYDDGRHTPYSLEFRQDDVPSLYLFNSAGYVTNVKVDREQYKVCRRRTPSRNVLCVVYYQAPSR